MHSKLMHSKLMHSRQHFHSRNTSGRQGRPNRRIISEPSDLNRHSGGATKINQAYVQIDKRYEKDRDSDLQHRHGGRMKYDGKRVPTLCYGWTYSPTQKEFLLLRTKEDDGKKVVGLKIGGREGIGMQ